MFTGIVKAVGRVASLGERGGVRRIAIDTGDLSTGGWQPGDSIAVSGVCLTAVSVAPRRFEADLSGETLARTTLGSLAAGSAVNLEPALRAADALGGHLVTGHVDGVARVRDCREQGGALETLLGVHAQRVGGRRAVGDGREHLPRCWASRRGRRPTRTAAHQAMRARMQLGAEAGPAIHDLGGERRRRAIARIQPLHLP